MTRPSFPPSREAARLAASRTAQRTRKRLRRGVSSLYRRAGRKAPAWTRKQRLGVELERRLEACVDEVRAQVAPLARGRDPVLVGPFTGEVGFELLYWIPLLRWVLREYPALRGRVVVVSRGGVEHWLTGLDVRYVDILSLYSPEELVARRPSLKQKEVTDFELELYERVRERLALGRVQTLHPSVFFRIYYRLRKIDRYAFARSVRTGADGKEGLLGVYEPLPKPALGALTGELPEDYVAVRFYFRPSFPDTPENRRFASAMIESLAREAPVVLLNNRLELDDHDDFVDGRLEGRVTTIDRLMTPETNLHVQTVAISRARAFVGTYGGLAYLAPFLGVPSVSFSSLPEHTFHFHLDLARGIFDGPPWGSLFALRPEDVDVLGLATGGLRGALAAGPRP